MKILVIEDDPFLSGLISGKLEREGFHVCVASNGEEAIEKANNEIPDFIVTDLMIPKIGGLDTLEKIRTNKELVDKPVIIFSNVTEEKEVARAKELGAKEFMLKSNFTLDELVEKIKHLSKAK